MPAAASAAAVKASFELAEPGGSDRYAKKLEGYKDGYKGRGNYHNHGGR